ncbi:TPA_asm: M [Howea betacytorhabdovirus 1]|nr:TPA_asm: M [Howea betacytorhabdovirus 1]
MSTESGSSRTQGSSSTTRYPIRFISIYLDMTIEIHSRSADPIEIFPKEHIDGISSKLKSSSQDLGSTRYLVGLSHWIAESFPYLVVSLRLSNPSIFINGPSKIDRAVLRGLYVVKISPNLTFSRWHLYGEHNVYSDVTPGDPNSGIKTLWKYNFNDSRCQEISAETAEKASRSKPGMILSNLYTGYENIYEEPIPVRHQDTPKTSSKPDKH